MRFVSNLQSLSEAELVGSFCSLSIRFFDTNYELTIKAVQHSRGRLRKCDDLLSLDEETSGHDRLGSLRSV